MILQMKYKTKFLKIGPCTFNIGVECDELESGMWYLNPLEHLEVPLPVF